MASIERQDDISLNGVHYKILGQVQKSVISQFPGKVTIGDANRSSMQNVSEWVISDVSGGGGIENINEREHADRFWYTDGMWTTDKLGIHLPPEWYPLGQDIISTDPTFRKGLAFYSDKIYMWGDTTLYRWNTTDRIWDLVLTASAAITDVFSWVNSSGTKRIYVAVGASGYYYSTSGDASSYTNNATDDITFFAEFDGKLIGLDRTTQALKYSTDGAAWTALVNLYRPYNVNGLAVIRDEAGEEKIVVGCSDGVFYIDFWTGYIRKMVDLSGQPYQYAGEGMIVHRNELYIPVHHMLLRLSGNTVVEMGLTRDDGEPTDVDTRIRGMVGYGDSLFAHTSNQIKMWNGRGWHTLLDTGSTTIFGVGIYGLSNLTDTSTRLYFNGKTSGNHYVYYLDLPLTNYRPQRLTGFAYADTNTIYTGDFDASFGEWDKVITSLAVRCSGMSATETIVMSYSTDRGTTWTTIATLTSDGVTTSYIPSSSDKSGVSVKKVRLRFVLSRRTTNLLTNGGFETAGAGGADVFGTWLETASDGTIEQSVTAPQAGTYSALLTAGPTKDTRIVTPSIAVTGGNAYELSYYTKGSGTQSGRHLVYDVTNSANIIALISAGQKVASWKQVKLYFIAPSTCANVNVQLYCADSNGAAVYFDTVSLVSISHTPVIESCSLRYYLSPTTLYGYKVTIDCREDWDGRTPNEQMTALMSAIATATQVVFTYKDNDDIYVRIMPSGGNESGGVAGDVKGIYTITMQESG